MGKVKDWFDRKAKVFIMRHVDMPISKALARSHHERIGELEREVKRVKEYNIQTRTMTVSSIDMLLGSAHTINGMTTIDSGLIERNRELEGRVAALEKSVLQLAQIFEMVKDTKSYATKNDLADLTSSVGKDILKMQGLLNFKSREDNDLTAMMARAEIERSI